MTHDALTLAVDCTGADTAYAERLADAGIVEAAVVTLRTFNRDATMRALVEKLFCLLNNH
jgi:hypothetical protein